MPSSTAVTDAEATPLLFVVTVVVRLQVLPPFDRNSIRTGALACGRQTSSVAPAVWSVATTSSLEPLPTGSGEALKEMIRAGTADTVSVAADVAVSPDALTKTAR